MPRRRGICRDVRRLAQFGLFYLALLLSSRAAIAAPPARTPDAVVDRTAAPTVSAEQEQELDSELGLSVHGSGSLSWRGGSAEMDTGFNLALGQLECRWTNSTFGVYAIPRLKISPLGTSAERSSLFFQQLCAYVRHRLGEVKVGKVYQRFGRLWDYGMYGPLVANYDMTLQPDVGIAVEGAPDIDAAVAIDYAVQYFPLDGHAWSLHNADFFAWRHVRKQHIVVGHLAPNLTLGTDHHLAIGLSGQTFRTRMEGDNKVSRVALDVDYTLGALSAFAELGQQFGQDLIIETGGFVGPNHFVWLGAMFAGHGFNLRYHLTVLGYTGYAPGIEIMHQPGAEYTVSEHFNVIAEAVVWSSSDALAAPSGYKERSIYLSLNGNF